MNFNLNLNKTDKENFQNALNLFNSDLSHEELINLINSNSVVDKQVAILKLDKINSRYEAQLLVDHLTGQDGKIREAVSFKLVEFMGNSDLIQYFQNPENASLFLKSAIDINGNICRNTISAIKNLKNNHAFSENLTTELIELIYKLLEKIENFDIQTGKYKINKEVFKLYWALELLYEYIDFIPLSDIKSILTKTSTVNDYTIREKTAKILSKNFKDGYLIELKAKLKGDKNYFVSRL